MIDPLESGDGYMSVNWAIIGFGNGLLPVQKQAIIWTNADLLSIESFFRTKFIEMWIKIQRCSFKEMQLKMSSANFQPFCLGLNVLNIKIMK